MTTRTARSRKAACLTAGTLAAALLLAGCADSDKTTEVGAGAPITIGTFATLTAGTANAFVQPWSTTGVKAAVKAINADGGIDGHKLKVAVCDNSGDPNKGAACAQKAVSDGWLAVVGGFDSNSPSLTLPILEAASVPYLGFLQVSPVEYQSKVSFPIEAGSVGGASGTAAMMADDGCKKPGFIGSTDAGNKAVANQVAAIFKKAGVSYAGTIGFPTGTTDVNPIVASALAQKPDCLMFNGAGTDAAKVFIGVRKAGSTARIYAPAAVLDPNSIKAMGDDADGVRGASTAPLSNSTEPAMERLVSDVGAYDPKAPVNEFTINGYAAVKALQQALTGLKDLTAKGLLAKLNTMTSVTPNRPAVDFTKTRDSKVYRALFDTHVWYSQIKNGAWTSAEASSSDIDQYLP